MVAVVVVVGLRVDRHGDAVCLVGVLWATLKIQVPYTGSAAIPENGSGGGGVCVWGGSALDDRITDGLRRGPTV